MYVTKNTSFKKLAPVLNNSFANHGVPDVSIHDGDPPYTNNEWTKYAQETGFKSELNTPHHPQSNGMVEKLNALLVKFIHASLVNKKDPKQEVAKFLRNYRNIPHSVTGKTPSELMIGYKLHTKVPVSSPPLDTPEHKEWVLRDQRAKLKAKRYSDKRKRAKS